ncbi:MAG: hypothetical protein V3S41_09285 [Spirochaetia bacterium]
MKSIAPMLEQELEGAVEIKDKNFLHRYITLMAENFVQKEDHVTETGLIRSDIQILAESMKQSLDRMDRRFEAADKRFTMMFSFVTIGFVVISTMVTAMIQSRS